MVVRYRVDAGVSLRPVRVEMWLRCRPRVSRSASVVRTGGRAVAVSTLLTLPVVVAFPRRTILSVVMCWLLQSHGRLRATTVVAVMWETTAATVRTGVCYTAFSTMHPPEVGGLLTGIVAVAFRVDHRFGV